MKIAVVIPALDESTQIAEVIQNVLEKPAEPAARVEGSERRRSCEFCEVWVVDGGSRDDTRSRAARAGAQVVRAERGRARQLQAGVEALCAEPEPADAILFLHADTRLPSGWARAVGAALSDRVVVGGAFGFRFADGIEGIEEDGINGRSRPGWREWLALRWVERVARLRVSVLGLAYGDQAIFARREVLERMGGVPQVELMEDLDLVRALRSRGRWVQLAQDAYTSARRHRTRGVMRTATWHAVALAAWALGVPRPRIARWLDR